MGSDANVNPAVFSLRDAGHGDLDGQSVVVAERSRREHLERRAQSCVLQSAESAHRILG